MMSTSWQLAVILWACKSPRGWIIPVYNNFFNSIRWKRELDRAAVIQQPKLECRSCVFNELMVRSDTEKGWTSLGYLVPLQATNEENKHFGLWSKQQWWQHWYSVATLEVWLAVTFRWFSYSPISTCVVFFQRQFFLKNTRHKYMFLILFLKNYNTSIILQVQGELKWHCFLFPVKIFFELVTGIETTCKLGNILGLYKALPAAL